MSAQIIFYSDSAKSGNTFLQRILNFYPDIGCFLSIFYKFFLTYL